MLGGQLCLLLRLLLLLSRTQKVLRVSLCLCMGASRCACTHLDADTPAILQLLVLAVAAACCRICAGLGFHTCLALLSSRRLCSSSICQHSAAVRLRLLLLQASLCLPQDPRRQRSIRLGWPCQLCSFGSCPGCWEGWCRGGLAGAGAAGAAKVREGQ